MTGQRPASPRQNDRPRYSRRHLLALGAASALTLAGCTSNQSQGNQTTPTPSPTSTDTTSPSETEESTTPPDETTTTAEQNQEITGQWPQFQFNNQRTGYNPDATGPTASPATLWTRQLNNPVATSPILVDNTVYIADDDGNLYALTAGTGDKQWTTQPGYFDGLTYHNGTLYGASSSFHIINPATGKKTGGLYLSAEQGSPLAHGNTVVTGGSGYLFALNADTGQEQWQFDKRHVLTGPALTNEALYAGTTQGVIKVNMNDGSLQWERTIKEEDGVGTIPTVANGSVYAVTSGADTGNARVAALKTGNGDERWHMDLQGRHASSPALAHGKVFVQDQTGTVYAFDTATGTKQWSTTTGTWPDSLTAAPVIAESTLYIGGKDKVHAVNTEDGSTRWTFTEGAGFTTAPAVADGTVIIGSKDGTVYALEEA